MHQKHPKIARPPQRTFGRTAFSLVGTSSTRIDSVMDEWLPELAHEFRVIGVSGTHQELRWAGQGQHGSQRWMAPQGDNWNEYDDRLQARTYDLALINGNYYPAERQIVFLDAEKTSTLKRRREQLTQVVAIIKVSPDVDTPEWLSRQLSHQPTPPVFTLEQSDQVLGHIKAITKERSVPLKALILAGGKSSRMGQDKGQLTYRNGQTELERITSACQQLGLEVFHSVQSAKTGTSIPQIGDRFLGLGPMGAIASAFLHDPESAWLVVACDLPLLEKGDLEQLITNRDTRRYATAIRGASQPFPEPLITIYEPRCYERILRFLSLGYACPRKVLINSDIATSQVKNERPLTNANTPADRQRILKILQS